MNYQEALAKAKESGMTNRLSSNRLDLAIGDEIVGKYINRVLIKSTKKQYPDSFRYSFELDEGPADLFFSNSFDNTVGSDLHGDHIYHIKYDDKVDIGDGKSFKKYIVEEIILDIAPTKKETK